MHIALLGLSADPPHRGHLAVSRYVRGMGYNRVWWVITPQNPAKHAAVESYFHRRELARLLVSGQEDWLEVSDFEAGMSVLDENIRTFTLLSHLHRVFPGVAFTFVVGADNWADPQSGLHTWGEYTRLLNYAAFLVLPRQPWTSQVATCPATRQLAARQVGFTPHQPVAAGCWAVATVPTGDSIASRHIRGTLAESGTSAHLTPAQLAYIQANGLYSDHEMKR